MFLSCQTWLLLIDQCCQCYQSAIVEASLCIQHGPIHNLLKHNQGVDLIFITTKSPKNEISPGVYSVFTMSLKSKEKPRLLKSFTVFLFIKEERKTSCLAARIIGGGVSGHGWPVVMESSMDASFPFMPCLTLFSSLSSQSLLSFLCFF